MREISIWVNYLFKIYIFPIDMRFKNIHLMILFRQRAVRKWVCLCVKRSRIFILCVLRWEKIYRQFLTKAIDHLYQRDNTDSHKAFWEDYSTLTLILQCFVFVVVIYIFSYFNFEFSPPTFTETAPSKLAETFMRAQKEPGLSLILFVLLFPVLGRDEREQKW